MIYGEREALKYEADRAGKPGWSVEHSAVAEMLGDGPVLDVPVGTGRFIELYRSRGLPFIGIDKSQAMLDIAKLRAPEASLWLGDVLDLAFLDKSFGTAVCIRLLPWLDVAQMSTAISELVRVADVVVLSVRLGEEGARCWRGSVTHGHDTFVDAVAATGATITHRRRTGANEAGEFWIVRLACSAL